MSARRPLLTALGATGLLTALWFVPSANATAPELAADHIAAPAGRDTVRTGIEGADMDGTSIRTVARTIAGPATEAAQPTPPAPPSPAEQPTRTEQAPQAPQTQQQTEQIEQIEQTQQTEQPQQAEQTTTQTTQPEQATQPTGTTRPTGTALTPTLADTGSLDTTPYLLGGTLLLGLGAGFLTFSARRSPTP
ncbi:hypothetical protein [Streptomyces sp. NPDC051567]|uniref:hypothetical protein n=1 Tax=Streptomyces sp. NPDC051567 TaxID=3365660 RepID=UPI0037BC8260